MELFHSIWTVLVMVIFLGIVCWAYSGKRKQRFEQAAQLPFDDDLSTPTKAKEPE